MTGFFVMGGGPFLIKISCLYCDFYGTLWEVSEHEKECSRRPKK